MDEHEVTAKTIIAEDIEIVGSIKCESNIQFNGKLNGDLNCIGDALIGNTANVKGNITVNCITVYGHVSGNITAKDKIELKSNSYINGDVRAKRMTVEDGVTFVGKSEVNPSGIGAPRTYATVDLEPQEEEIQPPSPMLSDPQDADVSALREEIRKNVKEEVKGKASAGFFGMR